MRVAEAVVDVLRSEGVDRVFGNPGTSELPLVEAIGRSDINYCLALQEASAVAMADGYARMTHRPAFVNLHVGGGLTNGLSNVINARRSRIPLVVTAGQQDTRHLDQEPMLSADNVGLAQAACKAAVEPTRAADLPVVLRRAFRASTTPPEGPVFVSIPMDLLEERLDAPPTPRSVVTAPGAAEGVEQAAQLLAAADRPCLIAGDGIGRENAVTEAVRVAERLGAPVYLAPLYDLVDFPGDHPLTRGMLPSSNAGIQALLEGHDAVLLVGVHAFSAHYYTGRDAFPAGLRVVQIDSDPGELARNHPVTIGLAGGIRATLVAFAEALAGGHGEPDAAPMLPPVPVPRIDGEPDPADAFACALVGALPATTVVVEEALSFTRPLRSALRPSVPGQFHHCSGGALGWGIGAALGVKAARPNLPVVAVVGDGSALYAVQGLWSAAHYRLGAVIVVVNNREYRVLRDGLDHLLPSRSRDRAVPGLDICDPDIDWVALAGSMGVAGVRADTPEELAATLSGALRDGAPALVDMRLQSQPGQAPAAVARSKEVISHGD